MPLNPTFPPKCPRLFHNSKKWIFSGRVFCADSEYMLDVAYKLLFAEKSPKKPVFWQNSQKVEKPHPKINFIFFYLTK
jgi:hypothetical protein